MGTIDLNLETSCAILKEDNVLLGARVGDNVLHRIPCPLVHIAMGMSMMSFCIHRVFMKLRRRNTIWCTISHINNALYECMELKVTFFF